MRLLSSPSPLVLDINLPVPFEEFATALLDSRLAITGAFRMQYSETLGLMTAVSRLSNSSRLVPGQVHIQCATHLECRPGRRKPVISTLQEDSSRADGQSCSLNKRMKLVQAAREHDCGRILSLPRLAGRSAHRSWRGPLGVLLAISGLLFVDLSHVMWLGVGAVGGSMQISDHFRKPQTLRAILVQLFKLLLRPGKVFPYVFFVKIYRLSDSLDFEVQSVEVVGCKNTAVYLRFGSGMRPLGRGLRRGTLSVGGPAWEEGVFSVSSILILLRMRYCVATGWVASQRRRQSWKSQLFLSLLSFFFEASDHSSGCVL